MRQLAAAFAVLALVLLAGCAAKRPEPPEKPAPQGGGSDWTDRAEPDGTKSDKAETDGAPKDAELSFESFDGGGPEYRVVLDDPALLSYRSDVYYYKEDHEQMTGAGYRVAYTFTGLKAGATTLIVESRSPIAGNCDYVYDAVVDEALNVTLTERAVIDPLAPKRPPVLALSTGERTYYARLEDDETARAFIELLSPTSLALTLREEEDGVAFGGELPWELPRSDLPVTAEEGDVVLDAAGRLGVCREAGEEQYTLLAKLFDPTENGLLGALAEGEVRLTLWLEWEE